MKLIFKVTIRLFVSNEMIKRFSNMVDNAIIQLNNHMAAFRI